MKIYISIPVTCADRGKTRERADLIKAALSRQGHRPVSPLDIYAGELPAYGDHLCYGLRAMFDCDAVYFCRGWEQSLGCCIEHDAAMRSKSYVGRHPHAMDFKIMYE